MNENSTDLKISSNEELAQQILDENNLDQLDSIISLFNLNIQKKNIIRASKLTDLQDQITAQMERRINKRADEFSNQDLLTYFKTIQDTLTKSDTTLDSINRPAIQLTQNQININMNNDATIPRESREKVIDAIRSIIKNNSNIIDMLPEECTDSGSTENCKDDSTFTE